MRCLVISFFFFFNDTATTEIYTLSLHDALPIFISRAAGTMPLAITADTASPAVRSALKSARPRSEEHTSELQSRSDLVCRLLLEKKKNENRPTHALQSQFMCFVYRQLRNH